jgi:hypothetical protein
MHAKTPDALASLPPCHFAGLARAIAGLPNSSAGPTLVPQYPRDQTQAMNAWSHDPCVPCFREASQYQALTALQGKTGTASRLRAVIVPAYSSSMYVPWSEKLCHTVGRKTQDEC